MGKREGRLLEEMVYERLLVAIDPDRILELGRDLDRCLEGALEPAQGRPVDADAVKRALLRRALARLGDAVCDLAGGTLPLP